MSYDKDAWRAQVENGQIDRSMLAEIVPRTFDTDLGGPALMHPEAAEAMSAFIAEGQRLGHPLKVTFSYRTLAKQHEKWQNYIGPDGIQGTDDDGNLAATPGTSNHGWAVSVDFNTSASDMAWAHSNCRRFAFLFDVASEIWHCTYQGGFEGPPKEDEDDVNLEKYDDGWQAFETKVKAKPTDPGAPPDSWAAWKKKGWNAARFAYRNPK